MTCPKTEQPVLGQDTMDGFGTGWGGLVLARATTFFECGAALEKQSGSFPEPGLGLRSWAACYRSYSVRAHLREEELARVGPALQGRTCYWVELAALPLVASLFVQSVGMEQ